MNILQCTFAVWLTPRSQWPKRYQGWGALEELHYVDRIARRLGGVCRTRPAAAAATRPSPARMRRNPRSASSTSSALPEEMPLQELALDTDLADIFNVSPTRRTGVRPAQEMLHQHRKPIIDKVAYWSGVQRPIVKRLVEAICKRVEDLGCVRIPHGVHRVHHRTLNELPDRWKVHSPLRSTVTPIGGFMAGTKLKVTVLYDLWEEEPAPVEEEVPPPRKRAGQKKRKKKPVKHDREEVFEALEKLGHEPSYYVLNGRTQSLVGLAKCGADLIFNLTESYAGDNTKEMQVTAFLDMLDIPYTGSGPHANILAQDKSIAKKMFAFHGIQSPYFATAYRGTIDHAHDISFPLIVKPTSEDGSIGIDAAAVVNSVKELMERLSYIQTEFNSPALIEEYIEGREIYAAILGNYENAYALPLVELDLSKLPKGMPKIASSDVKFEKDSEAYKLTKSAIAEDLDEETVTRLSEIAIKAYRAVKLRDYRAH